MNTEQNEVKSPFFVFIHLFIYFQLTDSRAVCTFTVEYGCYLNSDYYKQKASFDSDMRATVYNIITEKFTRKKLFKYLIPLPIKCEKKLTYV